MRAKYNATCGACLEKISVGDEIRYTDEAGWTHEDCYDMPTGASTAEVCTECFIQKPCRCDS